jgi:SPP1 gp7 family putative phage head morphogenesis protein
MSAASDFARLQRLPPAEAMAFMDGRQLTADTYHWHDLWRDEHQRAFTVSRLARGDLLEALQASLAKSVAGDLSRRDWIKSTEQLLKNAGWWGTTEVTDPRTGEMLKTRFNHARLQLIFDTNVRQAAAAGQWQRMLRNQRTHPFARYVAMDDDRTRPQHRAWHNVTLPLDDPWWSTHRPPNGYRCRCRMIGVTQREYDQGEVLDRPGAETDRKAPIVRAPMAKTAPPEALRDWRNPATGAIEKIPDGIDPGFDYNPGTTGRSQAFEAMVQAKLARMLPAVAEAASTAGVLSPRVAKEVPGQDNWVTLGLTDLRDMPPSMAAPNLLAPGATVQDAVQVLREALDVPTNGARFVETPTGLVAIFDKLLSHVVEKRLDRRERFGSFVLPTLQQPDEVWETAYDDATTRRRFIKLFSDSKYDLLVIVREGPDGAVLWNVLNRERKAMNTMRTGRLVHSHGRKAGDDVG